MLTITSSNQLEKSCILYDADTEDLANKKEYVVTASDEVFIFYLSSLVKHPFSGLKSRFREADFDEFLHKNGFTFIKYPKDSFFDRYKGSTELALHYAILPSNEAGLEILVVSGFGEFQPSRWMMVLEGMWSVSEV